MVFLYCHGSAPALQAQGRLLQSPGGMSRYYDDSGCFERYRVIEFALASVILLGGSLAAKIDLHKWYIVAGDPDLGYPI